MRGTTSAILLLIATPAAALDQGFLGTWAPDPASCARDGTAWFRISSGHMGGREFSCDLTHATSTDGATRVQYSCAGEGDSYSLDLGWRLAANGHLLEQAEGALKEYVPCGNASPPPAAAPPVQAERATD